MLLNDTLYRFFLDKARETTIEHLSLGLGYSAVTTSDGGIGLAGTYIDRKDNCSPAPDEDYEGMPASRLLKLIKSPNALERTMALALINALNYKEALSLPEDSDNAILCDTLDLREGRRVAMVGYFGPLVKLLNKKKTSLEIIDEWRHMGQTQDFYRKLDDWAQVLIMTATTILNNSTEEIFSHAGKNIKAVILGPSTPMVEEPFKHLPVCMLAGTVPLEKEMVLKAVRHGKGTPTIHRFSRKAYLKMQI